VGVAVNIANLTVAEGGLEDKPERKNEKENLDEGSKHSSEEIGDLEANTEEVLGYQPSTVVEDF